MIENRSLSPIPSERQQFEIDYAATRPAAVESSGAKKRLVEKFKKKITGRREEKTIEKAFKQGGEEIVLLRKEFNLPPPQIKLGYLVAFSETVIADKDPNAREYYYSIFETGLMQALLDRKLRVENQVASREMKHIIANQSPDSNRSIVELTSNGIDFSQSDAQVEVDISDTGYRVRDYGKGMNPVDIFEKLLIPTISGVRGKDKASIGKFGVGFMTSLSHLKKDGDSVTVKTSYGGEGYQVKFVHKDGEIYVELGKQQDILQGTEVAVNCQNFDQNDAHETLTKHLGKKRGAVVQVNGEQLNALHSIELIENENSALLCEFSDKSPEDSTSCTAQIMINGVMIEERILDGIGLPQYFAIDLPYNTTLPESRNAVAYDETAYNALQSLVSNITKHSIPRSHLIQLINGLAPLINSLQQSVPSLEGRTDLLQTLSTDVVSYTTEKGLQLVPNRKDFLNLSVENGIYVSDLLPDVEVLNLSGIEKCSSFESSRYRAYLIDFKEDAKEPALVHGNLILIDKKAYAMQGDLPVLLDLYLNIGRKEPLGSFVEYKAGKSEQMKQPVFEDSYEDIFRKDVSISLKSHIYPKHLSALVFGSQDSITLDNKLVKMMAEYLYGNLPNNPADEQNSITFDLSDNDMAFLQKIRSDSGSRDLVERARGFFSFFSNEGLKKLISLSPEERNSEVAAHIRANMEASSNLFHPQQIALLEQDLSDSELILKFGKITSGLSYQRNYEPSSYPLEFTGVGIKTYKEEITALDTFQHIERENPWMASIVRKYISLPDYFSNSILDEAKIATINAFYYFAQKDPVFMNEYYESMIKPLIAHPAINQKDLSRLFLTGFDAQKAFLYQERLDRGWQEVFTQDISAEESIRRIIGCDFDHYKRVGNYSNRLGTREFTSLKDMTLDIFSDRMREIKQKFCEGYRILGQNCQNVLDIPQVRERFERLQDEFTNLMYGKYFRKENSAFSLLYAEDIQQNIENFTQPISKEKLQIVGKTIQEHFNPQSMSLADCRNFMTYLKRVMEGGALSDQEFAFAQTIYLSNMEFRDYESNVSPRYIFDPEIVKSMYQKLHHLSEQKVADFLTFWSNVAHTWEESHGGNTTEENLNRALSIWIDVSGKSHTEYQEIIELFGSTDRDLVRYGYFKTESDQEPHMIPPAIRPYVLHYAHGDINFDSQEVQEKRLPIERAQYPFALSLTDLTLARKLRADSFMRQAKDSPDKFSDWVKKVVVDKDNFVTRRELLHGIFHQSASDPYLFLRELIQNSYDAVSEHKESITDPSMSIREFKQDNNYILQIVDHVGMDFDTVMGYLFIPEYSSKGSGQLGQFGIGFLSIFRDAEKVVIKTKKNGAPVSILATPVTDSSGNITDIQIEYDFSSQDESRGTVIQKYMKSSASGLQSAYIEDAVIRYGTHIDASQMQITFNEDKINHKVDVLASTGSTEGETFPVLSGAATCITQGGVYVMDMPPQYIKFIPEGIREMVIKNGFVFDLPKSIQLTRSRNDIAGRQNYEELFRQKIPLLALNGFLKKFQRGEIDFGLIPYDYFYDDDAANRQVSEQTREDAEEINSGGQLEDYSQYNHKFQLLELLTKIKSVDYKDEKLSLQEIAGRIGRGYYFDKNVLPSAIVRLIEDAEMCKRDVQVQKTEFYKDKKQEIVDDFSWSPEEEQAVRKKGYGVYVDFLSLSKQVSYPYSNGEVAHTYYYSPDGTMAHAKYRLKGWNLLGLKEGLISGFESCAGRFYYEESYKFWKKFLETSTHEDAHIEAKSNHWGEHHNDVFYETQRKIIHYLIYNINPTELQKKISRNDSYSNFSYGNFNLLDILPS